MRSDINGNDSFLLELLDKKPSFSGTENRRILVVDDEPDVLRAYETVFKNYDKELNELIGLTGADNHEKEKQGLNFTLTTAQQGQEALLLAERAVAEDVPFAMAFIDVRMPPGIDGLETAKRLRAIDPYIYLVIVTAYSDHDIDEYRASLDHRLIFLSKPFVSGEIEQIAYSNCISWDRDREYQHELDTNIFLKTYLHELFSALPVPVHVIDVADHQILFSSDPHYDHRKKMTCHQLTHHSDLPVNAGAIASLFAAPLYS